MYRIHIKPQLKNNPTRHMKQTNQGPKRALVYVGAIYHCSPVIETEKLNTHTHTHISRQEGEGKEHPVTQQKRNIPKPP